jgi:hypothetical protein
MLDQLLSFKIAFKSDKPQFSDVHSFQNELLAFHQNKSALPLSASNNDYWDRYTHSILLSVFLVRYQNC